MKKILVIIDKTELQYFEFNKLVTNFWLIKEFLERGYKVDIAVIKNLYLERNIAKVHSYQTFLQDNNIFYKNVQSDMYVDDYDLVFFRPDPPVDIDYINATYVLDFAKTQIINSPRAIRNFNEKLHSLYFADYMPDAIVSSSMKDITKFLDKHNQIILKPLNRLFGSGVMYLYKGDPNTNTIINTVTNDGRTICMVQKYLPDVKNGDVRILTCGNKILPYCIKKMPGNNDFKFNEHSNKYLVKADLTESDYRYFEPIAEKLNSFGIKLAGLDVIGKNIIEINVTSPCYFINEINGIYDIHLEKILADNILTMDTISV